MTQVLSGNSSETFLYPKHIDQKNAVQRNPDLNVNPIHSQDFGPPPKLNNAPLVGGSLVKQTVHHPSRYESLVYADNAPALSRLDMLKSASK